MNSLLKIIKFGWMMRRVVKAQRRSQKTIKIESRNDLFNETLVFMAQHQIHLESDLVISPDLNVNPLYEIETLLKKFSSFENEYRLMENKIRVYEKTFLSALILYQGRQAIDFLNEIDAKNKRVAYYESNKKSSLDDLIDHWNKKLAGENENKISHPMARRELKVRRMLAVIKKNRPQHINFFLLHYAEMKDDEYLNTELESGNIKDVITDILNFFEVGYATEDMICKSIAIQIFELFKNDIPIGELKETISHLLFYSFGKEYKNFTNFNKKEVYLKNVVGDFAILDFDNEETLKQKNRIGRIFINGLKKSNPIFKNPKFASFLETMAFNPLAYRLLRLKIKYFGFLPKNFSSYLPK